MFRGSQLGSLFRCIRWGDVIILEGVPILGVLFARGSIAMAQLVIVPFFAFACFLLLAHVFTLNDWADFTRGVHHSNLAMLQLESRNVRPRQLFIFSFLILAVSGVIFLFLSERSLLFAIAVAALGIFYSHPSLNAKSMPVISTVLHFVGGTLHFLLGYGLFSPIDRRGVMIGLFFGLTFAAGHPVQEARDMMQDRQAGATTNAMVFGQLPSFFASLILFTMQYVYLFWLAWSGLVPLFLAPCSLVAYPIHIWWAMKTLRRGLTAESITQFETRYRVLYAIIGLLMLLSIFGG